VADFIGDANLLTATIAEVQGSTARVQLDTLTVSLPSRGVPPGPVKLAIRPDAIRLSRESTAAPSIQGQVRKASYLGTHVEYEVGTSVGELFVVEHGGHDPLPSGTDVWVQLADRGVSIVPEG
jgi:iron(III) transport system ATP-binding protein